MRLKSILSFDIDGVLNNYPNCWLDYLKERTGIRFESVLAAKEKIEGETYRSIKDDYRFLGENSTYTVVNREMIELINKFHDAGFLIIFSTSRPINSPKYPNLYNQTYSWLVNEGVQFSELIYKDKSLSNHSHLLDRVLFHIDDDKLYVDAFKEFNIKSYLYSYVGENLSEISICDLLKMKDDNASLL